MNAKSGRDIHIASPSPFYRLLFLIFPERVIFFWIGKNARSRANRFVEPVRTGLEQETKEMI
jgi:hypothetical protein